MTNATRWGLVTFCIGITCGVLGHFLPIFPATVGVIFVSVFGAMVGSFSMENAK